MALLTLSDAENLASRGRPWSLRLEFMGANSSNQSDPHSAFWYATGRDLSEAVEMGWGFMWITNHTILGDFDDFRDKVNEKLAKGYQYVNAPYQKMSLVNMAKVMGQVPVPRGTQMPSSASVVPYPPSPATGVGALPQVASPAQAALASPYDLIRAFKVRPATRSQPLMMEALDGSGAVLLVVQVQEAIDFARDYVLDIRWT